MQTAKKDRVAMNLLHRRACACNTPQAQEDHKEDLALLESLLKEEGKEVKIAAKDLPDAFTDHEDFQSTLEDALSSDAKEEFDPNDMLQD